MHERAGNDALNRPYIPTMVWLFGMAGTIFWQRVASAAVNFFPESEIYVKLKNIM